MKPAAEKRSGPFGDLNIDMAVEYTKPGSPQDDALRREQAKAVLDLLGSQRGRRKDKADERE